MIKLICGLLSLILLICAIEGEIHMDCENPPAVEFASVEVVDNEDNVGAIYTCANGYELQGPLELLCDLDTDEWNTDPPICVPLNEVDNDGHEDDDDAANEIEPEPKRKRKQQHVVEDTQVPVEMASSLDMSCGQENITAPQVSNGYVKKYERRRRAQHIFLVAIYACNQNYEIEEHEVLYCSERRWIGNLPVCTSLNDDEEYEEYEEEEEKVTANEEERASQPELIDAKTDEADEDADEYKDEEESEHEEQVTEKAIATEDVKSTQDPYEPRLLDRDCGDTNGGCSQTCERVVFPGENEPRLKCSCYEGFSLDPYDYSSCHDIDECQINNGGCGQICNNTPGSFHCSCEQGLQIDGPNGKTCIDINECESPEVEQECGGACENTQGSYRCLPVLNTRVEPIVEPLQCAEGFELNADGTECLDVDECAAETHECSHECLNTSGGYECSCPGGYRLSLNNKYACEDIDECLAEPQLCGELTCTNFPGSYACKCADGSEPNAETGLCASEVLEPVCEAGFVLSADGQSCEDVDECQLANGGCEHICSNNKGSYTCDCPEGYQLQPDQRTCLDIDECSTHSHNCTHECLNTDGSYACACPTGYYLHDDKLSCLDVDECQSGAHSCSHECLNAVGSYGCICPAGFELTADERTCQLKAVDRCALQNGGCSHFCDNELGCSCPPGHKLASDNSSCIDVDECAISNGGCSHECLNREGGYDCRCPKGYELSAENPWSCVDINECLTPHICQHECHNSNGSYSCSCPFGYELRNERYCADIDECAVANGGCVGGECINHNGGHECRCAVGQRLAWDRRTCEARTDLRDACPPFKAPANGFIHCTKYRHKQQLFYKTKCEVGCNAGYRLEGASRRFCNSSGLWDQQKSVCTRVFCGGLPAPRYGRLMPFFCNSPMVVANTVCRLECWPGTYRPVGAAQSVCTEQGVWSHNRTMDCHNSYHHTRHRVNQVFQPRTISSSDGGFSIWGQSQAVPNTPPRSKLGKIESPIIVFCTPSFTVNLRPNQVTRSITWKEPRFKSTTLMKVNRSKIPGSLFGIGEHRIMYEATNADNIKSRCEFNIIVRAAASTPAPILPAMNLDFTDNGIMTRRGPLVSNSALIEPKLVTAQLLAGHEAYVICPGKMPYKVKSAQVNFPVNCQLKSVRTNSHTTQHRLLQRRLFTSQQWMPFTNY